MGFGSRRQAVRVLPCAVNDRWRLPNSTGDPLELRVPFSSGSCSLPVISSLQLLCPSRNPALLKTCDSPSRSPFTNTTRHTSTASRSEHPQIPNHRQPANVQPDRTHEYPSFSLHLTPRFRSQLEAQTDEEAQSIVCTHALEIAVWHHRPALGSTACKGYQSKYGGR